jgi:hypothetical protein
MAIFEACLKKDAGNAISSPEAPHPAHAWNGFLMLVHGTLQGPFESGIDPSFNSGAPQRRARVRCNQRAGALIPLFEIF